MGCSTNVAYGDFHSYDSSSWCKRLFSTVMDTARAALSFAALCSCDRSYNFATKSPAMMMLDRSFLARGDF